jgi:hypothetical protein
VTSTSPAGVHYDPYDVAIDDDPYPSWGRLRDEAQPCRNEALDLYTLSRWDDVRPALIDWETYHSGRGTLLDVVRVFTPRRMLVTEPITSTRRRRGASRWLGSHLAPLPWTR